MDKLQVEKLYNELGGATKNKISKYRLVVPVEDRVCVTLYKLVLGANLLPYTKLCALGQ